MFSPRFYFTICTFCAIFCTTNISGLSAQSENKSFLITKNLSILNAIVRELELNYVDSLEYDKFFNESIDGMLEKLDPYTTYFPESETEQLTFMTKGEYVGIGAIISKKGDDVCIAELYEGKPAQKANLRVGDVIVEINGIKIKGLSTEIASSYLKGPVNSSVKIKVLRDGKVLVKEFLREKIQINPVEYFEVVAPRVGYIKLGEFTDKSAFEFKKSLLEMTSSDSIESLIVDLRNNGGGIVDEAVKILGLFLPKSTLVAFTKGKNKQSDRMYKTPLEPLFPKMRIAVLTNRLSASASEILAGAFQDLDKGVIVGERTYGKGLVQSVNPIPFNGNLKITIAKYYIPSGRCIQAYNYSRREEDGSVARIPDSLTKEFKTVNGRIVRDGGGVLPDTLIKLDKQLNIAHYLYIQNQYSEFANDFVKNHNQIDSPDKFELDQQTFNDFVSFITKSKFTYVSQTQKLFNDFLESAKVEGCDKLATTEIEALKVKLALNIPQSMEAHASKIKEYLSVEIIKRYFYQKGTIEYFMDKDKEIGLAKSILQNKLLYDKILHVK